MLGRRAAVALVTAAVAGIVAMAGLGFACTNFIRIDRMVPATESPTPTAAVRGSGAAAGATVELRWNSPKGPIVGTAKADESGAFSTTVSIPHAPAGIYLVVASDGNTVNRAAYEVAAAPGAVTNPAELMVDRAPATAPAQLGLGLLVAGLVVLAGGFTVVALRRRPVLADRCSSA
ncbi:MAG: hypothetical protein ACRD2W_13900 [Acidimicrobiales bacterium]